MSDRALAVLAPAASPANWSGRLNDCLDRYGVLLSTVRVDRLLTEPQRVAILAATISLALPGDARHLRGMFAASVADSLPAEIGLDVDAHGDLARLLAGLTPLEEIALAEWLEREAPGEKTGG